MYIFKSQIPLKFLLLLALVLHTAKGYSQTHFKRISPKRGIIQGDKIVITPTRKGYIAGWYSPNAKDWYRSSNTIPGFDHVEFSSDSVIWSCHFNSQTSFHFNNKSTDGGKTWTNLGPNSHMIGIKFKDPLNGYALQDYLLPPASMPWLRKLIKTVDGGATWAEVPGKIFSNSASQIMLTDNALFVRSGRKVWKSLNGGTSWDSTTLAKNIRTMSFPSASFGYAVSDSSVFRTSNGGTTWTEMNMGRKITRAQFLDANTGWIWYFDGKGIMYRTTDGGTTWSGSQEMGGFFFCTDFTFLNAMEGWATFSLCGLHRTFDGGATWVSQTNVSSYYLTSAAFQNKDRLWMVGEMGEALITSDRGRSWTKKVFDREDMLQYVNFFTPQNGVIVGCKNSYRTVDGGENWSRSPLPGPYHNPQGDFKAFTRCVHFSDPMHGWFAKSDSVCKTSDQGITWQKVTTPYPVATHFPGAVFRVDSLCTYLVANRRFGATSILYKTVDGGQNWQQRTLPNATQWIDNLYFKDRDNGFLLSLMDSSWRTSDGGLTLQKLSPNAPASLKFHSLKSIKPLGDNHFLAAAYWNSRYYTLESQNNGQSWQVIAESDSIWNSQGSFGMAFGVWDGKPLLMGGGWGNIMGDPNWTPFMYAAGEVVQKQDENCAIQPADPRLQNRILMAEPGPYYGSTDTLGRYFLQVDSGQYQLKQVPYSPFYAQLEKQFCPPGNASISLSVDGLLDTIPDNNFINEVKECAILVLHQNQGYLRPCTTSNLLISVRNMGNVPSDTEYVHLKFPPNLHFVSTSAFYDYNATDSTYRFKILPIQAFGSVTIEVVDSVTCDPAGLTGHTLCVKATIPHAPSCLMQSAGWDGADLEIASICLPTGQARFKINNKGTSMPAASQYKIFIDSVLVYQASFQLAANSQMSVTLPANAPPGLVRLTVPQSANHPLSTFASAEANCASGVSTNGMFPQSDESPLVDIACVIVWNSWDPNDKTVYPYGIGSEGKVEPETEFKYKIRFQNTGTDTAFRVVLVDTLDAGLDIGTLQLMSASHPYTFKVSGKGKPVLSWTFSNILLPDSGTNQEGSHGFVNFSIRPKTGLALGTRLENFADIYFDFNDPVRTNTTVNTLWRPTLVDGVLDTVFTVTATKATYSEKDLSLFPNPSKGKLELNAPEAGRMTLYNIRGEMMMERPVEKGANRLDLSSLPKGLYVVRFQFANQPVMRKVVLE